MCAVLDGGGHKSNSSSSLSFLAVGFLIHDTIAFVDGEFWRVCVCV